MAELTTFDYLLNRMESDAAAPNPAKAGYAHSRRDVLGFVAAQARLIDGQAKLLIAYRTNSRRTPEKALDTIREAEETLAAYRASVGMAAEVPSDA